MLLKLDQMDTERRIRSLAVNRFLDSVEVGIEGQAQIMGNEGVAIVARWIDEVASTFAFGGRGPKRAGRMARRVLVPARWVVVRAR